jgi:transposase-like protein
MRKRKSFSPEFKRETVRLMESSGKLTSDLARELGIPRNRLYKWKEQLAKRGADAFPGKGRRGGEGEEVSQLKAELERVKEERDILKKAAAYFAKELK